MTGTVAATQAHVPGSPPTVRGFVPWLRARRGAVSIAGLLAFAGPVTYYAGALSLMWTPGASVLSRLALWWTLYGVTLWGTLVVLGYLCERAASRFDGHMQHAIAFLAACVAAIVPGALTSGRGTILIEQGLVSSTVAMHLHGASVALIMAVLYFAHLRRRREHERAAARLAAAQSEQRGAHRRLIEARLEEMQARIDPHALLGMLDTARLLYERDPARAERYLDELIGFLRSALPRLRSMSSSLAREAEIAKAALGLRALAADSGLDFAFDVAPEALHARFPPGILLPLVEGVPSGARGCRLAAARRGQELEIVLTVPGAPLERCLKAVRERLAALYGTEGTLRIEHAPETVKVVTSIPYEPA